MIDTPTLISRKCLIIDQLLDDLDELSNAIRYEALALKRAARHVGLTVYDYEQD